MEITCTRCHQTVEAETCFCPSCGLPQLVYSVEGSGEQGQTDRGEPIVRDAGSVNWKRAMRAALTLAVPAGILCSMLSPLSVFGLVLMAGSAIWVVALYLRSERPAWITIGAGARIGLLTGILGGWTAAAVTGATLFAIRYLFHQGKAIDNWWQNTVNQQLSQQWSSMGVDAHTIEITKAWMLSPEGRAGWAVGMAGVLAAMLLLFAVAGGALGARVLGRPRRPQV
jgi:hypothetical protein